MSPPTNKNQSETNQSGNDTRKGIVLVVDDEERIRKIVSSNVKRSGFKVFEAENGETALKLAKEHLPDVILLDLMMPGIDGYEVCRRLKANPSTSDIPIIMVTAKTHVDDKVKGLDIGASDYLSKPFQIAELVSRVNAAFRMKKLQDELKEANHVKDKFLAIAAHDLRSPLSTINLWGGYLSDDSKKTLDEVTSAGKSITRITKRMIQLISDLLDTARLNLGVLKVNLVPIDLGELGKELYETYKPLMENEGLSFEFEIADNLPDVSADADRITEVLQNLISNAVKFTAKDGNVTLQFSKMTDDHLPSGTPNCEIADALKNAGTENFILCNIKDTGVGIPESDWHRIFDKYVQIEKRSKEKSTGLGLAICKEIISLHNGFLWVESKKSKGSTFSFAIPI